MIDRVERGNRAVILHPVMPGVGPEALDEFTELGRSAGVEIVATVVAPRGRPDARTFVGSGKVEELDAVVREHGADLILVSRPLSAVQERNIEKACRCRVLDRTTLILDIFAQRARSHEGKLQVELAQLRHLSTRLVRGWTHLERQKGGIGLRGPGETQLETDRRLIGQRIARLREKLEKVDKQRHQSRRRRERSRAPVVALVGYTNAGKSTLFNALTDADVDVRDMQFATLDPTVRRVTGLGCGDVLAADTVGFVSDLPHELINAFRSTLLETREADLLLHVVDASDPWRMEREAEVEGVLADIGSDRIPRIRVLNKIDLVGEAPGVTRDDDGKCLVVRVCALSGEGLDALREAISAAVEGDRVRRWIRLGGREAKLRARLFELGAVDEEKIADSGEWLLHVDLPVDAAEQLARLPGREGAAARHQLLSDETVAAATGGA